MNVSNAYYGVFWFDIAWTELVIGLDGGVAGAGLGIARLVGLSKILYQKAASCLDNSRRGHGNRRQYDTIWWP